MLRKQRTREVINVAGPKNSLFLTAEAVKYTVSIVRVMGHT
ncbi:MAG: hypothetical protein QW599_05675 [Nitrososphaerota archaeon]